MKPNLVDIASASASASATDVFADLANLRLSQDFAATCGVKKLLTTVPVRKPSSQDFVRVHADPAYRDNFPAIELKDEGRELYLISSDLQQELSVECVPVTLFTAINRQGVVFLWPARLPRPEEKMNRWWGSAIEAAELAMTRWIRVKPNMSLGAYEIFEAIGTLQEPTFTELPLNEIVRIAFRGNVIDNPDHPVVKRLRGLT
jgi:hypothetical protein